MYSDEEINRRLQQQEAEWAAMQGGGFGGFGGQQDYLREMAELNPGHSGIQDFVLQQMMQQQDPRYQWEMQSAMQNDALQRAMGLTELASMYQTEGGLSPEGQQLMQMGLGGLGVQSGMSGYGALGDVYQSIDMQMMEQIQRAAERGDFESAQQIASIRELAQQDPSIYEEWARKPDWSERLGSLGIGGAAGGVGGATVGAGLGALIPSMIGGMKAGGKIGSVVPGKGTVIGGVLGGLGGLGYGLRGLWDDESMRLDRDYGGYGTL